MLPASESTPPALDTTVIATLVLATLPAGAACLGQSLPAVLPTSREEHLSASSVRITRGASRTVGEFPDSRRRWRLCGMRGKPWSGYANQSERTGMWRRIDDPMARAQSRINVARTPHGDPTVATRQRRVRLGLAAHGVWEGEAPAEPKATAGRSPPEALMSLKMPAADAELQLVSGSAGASPSRHANRWPTRTKDRRHPEQGRKLKAPQSLLIS